MVKTKFWEDAARYGAYLGLADAAFQLLNTWKPSGLLSLVHIVVIVTLLVMFTKRRVALYGAEGYSYGQCWKYIFFVSVFAGILLGAYSVVASNFLFPEKYRELVSRSLSVVAQTGIYSDDMLRGLSGMYEKLFFSPLWVVLTNVLGAALRGAFYGLFIAAFTKREAPVFPDNNDNN
ncbi:MAG: DUF4199 domain-containing protein [Alistipes sp.]|nr:DUF4199 domain-containing protein [Alistipes sp.]